MVSTMKDLYIGINEKIDMFFVMEYDTTKNEEKIIQIFYNEEKCKAFIDRYQKIMMERLSQDE